MTNEEWLRHAVQMLNEDVFSGDLDILNHEFQINYGRCQGKKLSESIQPSDSEMVDLDDFFPTTISINFTIKKPIELLEALAFECMPAFFNMKPKGKLFKVTAEKYLFEKTDVGWRANRVLREILENVYKKMVKQYGEFPGKPVKFPIKEQKEKKKNSYAIFCPECGYEMKIARKVFEKHGKGLPTCPCGAKMGVDMEEDDNETNE